MKNALLDLALYTALAIAAGTLIGSLSPSDPQPTELPIRANETSVVKQSLTTPKPEPAEPSPPPQAPALVWHTNQQAAYAESLDARKPLLIVFTMPHDQCVPCKVFEEQVLTNERIGDLLSRFVCLKVGHAGAAEWNVTQFPRVAVVIGDKTVAYWSPTNDVSDMEKRLLKVTN